MRIKERVTECGEMLRSYGITGLRGCEVLQECYSHVTNVKVCYVVFRCVTDVAGVTVLRVRGELSVVARPANGFVVFKIGY